MPRPRILIASARGDGRGKFPVSKTTTDRYYQLQSVRPQGAALALVGYTATWHSTIPKEPGSIQGRGAWTYLCMLCM